MPCQSFSGDALDRGFAGGINVEDGQRVGILKRGGEFVHEVARTSVAVGLKNDVDFAEATLPRRRQRGANLGRVWAVVIDHADACSFAPQLEATVNAAEVFEGGADADGRDVETDSDRNG